MKMFIKVKSHRSGGAARSYCGRGILFVLLGVWLLSSNMGFAQRTNAAGRLTFDSFRTISDRNIFNPNRLARGTPRTTARTSSAPAARVESFSLVGIMAYEQGVFAFFDGTKPDYKQAVQMDGAIGEYKVAQITATDVKLARGTNAFDLKVGMQMRREDEGDWFVSEGGDAPPRRVVSTRTRTRGGLRGEDLSEERVQEISNGSEPEVIFIEGDLPAESNGGEANGGGVNGGEPPAAEVVPNNGGTDNGGITDPVLLRLMQRRQEMTQ